MPGWLDRHGMGRNATGVTEQPQAEAETESALGSLKRMSKPGLLAAGGPLLIRRGDGTSTYFIIDDNKMADDKTEREGERRSERDGDPPWAKSFRSASAPQAGRRGVTARTGAMMCRRQRFDFDARRCQCQARTDLLVS